MATTSIAAISILVFALLLLLAPIFEVKLTKATVRPIVVAALLMAIAFVIGSIKEHVDHRDIVPLLGIVSAVFVGFGLFLPVVACARFAISNDDERKSTPE